MGLDLVEIALDRLTDDQEFEKLATETLYEEGYYDIVPMPGGNDFGQDAIADKFYESISDTRTVFQYSLQGYSKGKIEKTIARLKEVGIKFTELVYVTNKMITGENQEKLKKAIRKDYRLPLTIFEKETFVSRLSNFSNGLFARHFPDIDKQIAALKANKPIISEETGKGLELSLLKVSIAFTFNKAAAKTRKDIFEHLILSLIYDSKKEALTIDELKDIYKSSIGHSTYNEEQIKSALVKLKEDKQIEESDSLIKLSDKAIQHLEATTILANQYTDTLLEDIYASVSSVSPVTLSKQDKLRIKRNALEVLIEIFKFYGIELTNQYLNQQLPNTFDIGLKEHFASIAKHNLTPKVGELLIASIGNILKSPTTIQAATIASWSKAYLGVKIMNFDPNLKELQYAQFSKKIFILDTDILLNCIVKERPNQMYFVEIIKDLLKLGCKIVIPTNVFEECLLNASISHRSYTFFGDSLHGLNDEFVEYEVKNLFVQGYFHYYKKYKTNFINYLSNYYDERNPKAFFQEVIYDVLPKEIEIVDLSSFNVQIPTAEFERFKNRFYERLQKQEKARYRTPDQTKELAKTDTALYLTCYYLNQQENNPGKVLGGKAYLLTQSFKYLKCAKDIGLTDIVTTKPQTLATLLDLIGKVNIHPREYIKLMDNPLLIYSVDQCWNDVQLLVKSGVNLQGKSLPRLRSDLQESLHDQIAAYNNLNPDVLDPKASTNGNEKLSKFFDLVKDAKRLGYKNLPEIELFMKEMESKKDITEDLSEKLKEVSKQYETFKAEVERFGKRRQHYLDKISKKK